MEILLAILEKIGLGAFAAWLGHKTDVAKQAGADEQSLKDLEAEREQEQASAAAGSAIDQRLSQQAGDADTVVSPTDPIWQDPSLKGR